MFEFMNQPISEGSATTWGQLIGQMVSMSNTQSGKQIGSMMQQQYNPGLQQQKVKAGPTDLLSSDAASQPAQTDMLLPADTSPLEMGGSQYLAAGAGNTGGSQTGVGDVMSIMNMIYGV